MRKGVVLLILRHRAGFDLVIKVQGYEDLGLRSYSNRGARKAVHDVATLVYAMLAATGAFPRVQVSDLQLQKDLLVWNIRAEIVRKP